MRRLIPDISQGIRIIIRRTATSNPEAHVLRYSRIITSNQYATWAIAVYFFGTVTTVSIEKSDTRKQPKKLFSVKMSVLFMSGSSVVNSGSTVREVVHTYQTRLCYKWSASGHRKRSSVR